LSNEATDRYYQQMIDAEAKIKAAEIAATSAFSDEPLPGVGAAAWRALWEAARKYSAEQVYPDNRFPYTGEGALCVLCQQPLSEKAADRLQRFESYVRAETQQAAEAARKNLDGRRQDIENALPSAEERRADIALLRDELKEEISAKDFERFYRVAIMRRGYILRTRDSENWPEFRRGLAVPADVMQ